MRGLDGGGDRCVKRSTRRSRTERCADGSQRSRLRSPRSQDRSTSMPRTTSALTHWSRHVCAGARYRGVTASLRRLFLRCAQGAFAACVPADHAGRLLPWRPRVGEHIAQREGTHPASRDCYCSIPPPRRGSPRKPLCANYGWQRNTNNTNYGKSTRMCMRRFSASLRLRRAPPRGGGRRSQHSG